MDGLSFLAAKARIEAAPRGEFGLGPYEETIQRDQCIHTRAANPITPEGKQHLPRVESCSHVTGKRRIYELDRNG